MRFVLPSYFDIERPMKDFQSTELYPAETTVFEQGAFLLDQLSLIYDLFRFTCLSTFIVFLNLIISKIGLFS